jgi:hypothetical protein
MNELHKSRHRSYHLLARAAEWTSAKDKPILQMKTRHIRRVLPATLKAE